ncbi:MAG TPA: phosphotransferase, partial [Abditibacteriaceae bacterium]|nr:phosphotransferase [Abditibacteriaceae bacterium]
SRLRTQDSGLATRRLTRRELEHLTLRQLHTPRNWSKADIFVGDWPPGSGQRVVVKDLKNRPLWVRLLGGRYMLRREWQVLCILRDMAEVPQPIARPDADAIVIEYRQGKSVMRFARNTLPVEFLEQVEKFVKALHARGVTHGDLHKDNILVEEDGSVAFIDWATANAFGPRPHGLKARIFAEWRALDRRALAKLKALHAPRTVTPDEREMLLHGGSRLYRGIKRLRHIGEKLRNVHKRDLASVSAKYGRILEQQSLEQKQKDS